MKDIQVSLFNNEFEAKTTSGLNDFISSQSNYVPSNIAMVNAPLYWQQGYTGRDVKIAVLDTGCFNHIDLTKNIIGGKNFTSEDNGNQNIYQDYNGHGTHCCGVIAGNEHIMGVAPNASLLVLKVLRGDGNGNAQGIIDAMNYAISQKVDIISMSLGMSVKIPELYEVVKRVVNNNILLVCAAGNNGDNNSTTDEFSYPAGYEESISVGAIDLTRSGATFTNSNLWIDCVAPGVDVISTYLNDSYCSMDGTSMATPHVTGVLALIVEKFRKEWGRNPSESEAYGQLIKNTLDIPNIPRSIQGNGMIYLR